MDRRSNCTKQLKYALIKFNVDNKTAILSTKLLIGENLDVGSIVLAPLKGKQWEGVILAMDGKCFFLFYCKKHKIKPCLYCPKIVNAFRNRNRFFVLFCFFEPGSLNLNQNNWCLKIFFLQLFLFEEVEIYIAWLAKFIKLKITINLIYIYLLLLTIIIY